VPGRKDNSLRTYHLLVVRVAGGFAWQIRYGRHASVVEQSVGTFMTLPDAETAGSEAVRRYRSAAASLSDGDLTQP
jgi:hypothetical protein